MAGLLDKAMGRGQADDSEAGAPETAERQSANTADVSAGIQVPPEMQEQYERIVLAGMKVMFSQETHEMAMNQLMNQEGELGEKVGKSVAGLLAMLFSESGGAIPPQLLIPSGVELTAQAINFINESGMDRADDNDLAEAVGTMIEETFRGFGMTPEQAAQAAAGQFDRSAVEQAAQQGA